MLCIRYPMTNHEDLYVNLKLDFISILLNHEDFRVFYGYI